MTEDAGMEKKMEQNTEENVIGQGIEDDQNIRNREDEVKDTYVDRQGTEPEMSGEDRKMYEIYMKKAIKLAQKAYVQGDVPIGCVIVKDNKVIARGYNKRNLKKTTLAHAELLAIEQASKKLGDWRLEDCTMYVTLEPCQMCAGAIVQARIPKVVIGCMNKKAGCAGSILNMFDMSAFNHQVETVYGSDFITDYIGDLKFEISPLSFFQVNPIQTQKLYGKALEYADLNGEEIVVDAYCGIGTISLFLAQKAKMVYGVEIVPQAIEDAKKNAKNNKIVVPAGFKIVSNADTNNATTVDKGIVIEDATSSATAGSQFVWIPVGTITKEDGATVEINLNRYTFDGNGIPTAQGESAINSCFSETASRGNTVAKNITNFKNSVTTNGGYYIGRYEARKNATSGKLTEVNSDSVWNNITQPDAATQARNMYDEKQPFTSDLMNSYAWDTATVFLQSCGTNNKYSRQTRVSSSLATTGTNNQTTKDVQCNVFDMASNVREWTTETSSSSSGRFQISLCQSRRQLRLQQ